MSLLISVSYSRFLRSPSNLIYLENQRTRQCKNKRDILKKRSIFRPNSLSIIFLLFVNKNILIVTHSLFYPLWNVDKFFFFLVIVAWHITDEISLRCVVAGNQWEEYFWTLFLNLGTLFSFELQMFLWHVMVGRSFLSLCP